MKYDKDKLLDVFNSFNDCYYMQVTKAGKIIAKNKINVSAIQIDKNGEVEIGWSEDKYRSVEFKPLNAVYSSYDDYIYGVFTDDNTALTIAKEWFKLLVKEQIDKIEKKKSELVKELNELDKISSESKT